MKTIYLADDDEDDRMLIRLAVEQLINPVQIVELASGGDLIKLIDNQGVSHNPAMIIMDMNMPRINGLETLAFLKSNDASRHLPVVMLSTTSNRVLVREAYERGVNAFLEKPVNESDFMKLAKAVKACFLNVSDEPFVHYGQQKGNVIVIEDEDHLFFIRHALHESMPEVQVIEFTNAAAAGEQLGAAWNSIHPAPHLILMDLYLPSRQDGLDLLVNIHQLLVSKNCRSVPIIVFSYSGKAEDIRSGYQRNFRWNTVSVPGQPLH
jgi:CheY-like chemotaxis protein